MPNCYIKICTSVRTKVESMSYIYVGLLQTVVCFPYLGGVIELGVTELVTLILILKYLTLVSCFIRNSFKLNLFFIR